MTSLGTAIQTQHMGPIFGASPTFQQLFGLGSAAYSTSRQLSAALTDIVRVRRSSDDVEQDFNANEVKNGTLLDFVVPTAIQAYYNKAQYFNGTSNSVSVGSTFDWANSWDIEFDWNILDKDFDFNANTFGANTNSNFGITYRHSENEWEVYIGGFTDGVNSIRSGITFNATEGQTYTLRFVHNGSGQIQFYVEGVLTATQSMTAPTSSGSETFAIGRRNVSNFGFKGFLSNITVINDSSTFYESPWQDNDTGTFTGQTYNGFVPIWYDHSVPTSLQRMYFDGTNDYVDCGDGTDFNFTTTLSVSCKAINSKSTLSGNNEYMVAKYDSGSNEREWGFAIDTNDKLVLFLGSATGTFSGFWTSDDVVDIENLQTYGFTYNSGTIKLYINGSEVNSSLLTGTIPTTLNNETAPITIGSALSSGSPTVLWEGIISDVSIHNAVLSDSEMLSLANGNTVSTGEVARYNGYGNTNTDWTDQVGSNDGTVNGSPIRCLTNLTLADDATQTTAGRQPRIVIDGALVEVNSKPAIDFDGSNDYLITPDYIVELSANDAQVSVVVDSDTSPLDTRYMLTEGDAISPYSSNFIVGGIGASDDNLWVNADGYGTNSTDQVVQGFEKTGGAGTGSKTFQAYKNGATDGASGSSTVNLETSVNTYIGASADGVSGFFNGKMQELITYKNTTNDITEIQTNQKNYYGIS